MISPRRLQGHKLCRGYGVRSKTSTPFAWTLSLVRTYLVFPVLAFFLAAGPAPPPAFSQEIVWNSENSEAAVGSLVNDVYGPILAHVPGGGDPLPLISPAEIPPKDCGWGWARAEAGAGYVKNKVKVWGDLPNPCDRNAYALSQWAGYISSPGNECFSFNFDVKKRYGLNGIYVSAGYIPHGGTYFKTLFSTTSLNPGPNYFYGEVTEQTYSLQTAILAQTEAHNDLDHLGNWWSDLEIHGKLLRLTELTCFERSYLYCAQINICMKCGGFRVQRIKTGATPQVGYIGACLYPDGKNAFVSSGSKFMQVNMSKAYNKVEVYLYDCANDTLVRMGYSSIMAYEADKYNLQNPEVTVPVSPIPDSPDAFQPLFPLQQSMNLASQGERVPALAEEDVLGAMSLTPFMSAACLKRDGTKYTYGLVTCDWVGVAVSPGDTVKFEGSGITGGYVSGNALNVPYGAWRVKEAGRGRVVFEATQATPLPALVDDFIILGASNSEAGDIAYEGMGSRIGNSGTVTGPVPKPDTSWLMLLLSR